MERTTHRSATGSGPRDGRQILRGAPGLTGQERSANAVGAFARRGPNLKPPNPPGRAKACGARCEPRNPKADGDGIFPLTTADMEQNRPDVAAGKNTFLAVWTDYRDTAEGGAKQRVYEYYGRVIGNDMALSSRWRNPESR